MADVALGEPTHVPATPPPVFELADVWTTRVDKRACSLLLKEACAEIPLPDALAHVKRGSDKTSASSARSARPRAPAATSTSTTMASSPRRNVAPRPRGVALVLLLLLLLATTTPREVEAYRSMAGSCEHAGVVHGDPPHPKRDGDGGFAIALGRPGVNVPGAVVPLSLSSSDGTPFKGFMIGAVRVDGATGKETPIGGWDPRSMPDGAQVHPLCPDHATHDAYRSSNPSAEAIVPWIAGTDGMAVGDVVKFKATVVRSHSTWHAFETTFEVGSARGAGFAAIALERGRAPGSDDGGTSGVRAPGMAAATLGGWREPPAGTTEGGGQKMGKVVIDAKVAARRRRERSRKEREESRREDVQKAREILGGFGGSAVKAPTAEKPAVEAPTTDAAALVAAADRRRAARLWHGFSMAFAWLLLAPASAFVARHGRDAPTWFAFHRAASYCAAGVTATSAWYIVAARGWSTAWGRHGRVGAYVVVGVALQAIGGYARKRYPRRRWAAFHRALGFACIALGAYNCVAGARLLGALEAGTRSAKSAAISAAATWAATFAVMERARGRGRAGTIKLSHTV